MRLIILKQNSISSKIWYAQTTKQNSIHEPNQILLMQNSYFLCGFLSDILLLKNFKILIFQDLGANLKSCPKDGTILVWIRVRSVGGLNI